MFKIALSECGVGSADANVYKFGKEIFVSRHIPETTSNSKTCIQTTILKSNIIFQAS